MLCCLQEWVYQFGQAVKSIFARGRCVDQEDTAGWEDGTQWDTRSEGYRLSDRLYWASNAAREISAECRQRVCRHIPTTQCRPRGWTTNSTGYVDVFFQTRFESEHISKWQWFRKHHYHATTKNRALWLVETVSRGVLQFSVVTIASEPASIDYDRSFEKKSRCRCRFDVTRACGLTISWPVPTNVLHAFATTSVWKLLSF